MGPEQLYRLHKERVYRLCLRFCAGNTALAEDITQDVFLKVVEHHRDLVDHEALEPWLYRVTTNACYTRMKRDTSVWNRVKKVLSLGPQEDWQTPEKQMNIKEELRQTMDALQELPDKERMVFCMCVLDGKSQVEIASILSLSKGYVSKLLQRARTHIERRGWSVGHV
jgi:RNA polymerase sigma-70 factor (ECF subfamily)